ncbi:hypothetical protein MJ585_27540 [Klebsiella pneumoniae]|nr:hypothetical protein MJ585_27540 [Klebsiella pneumoniae]
MEGYLMANILGGIAVSPRHPDYQPRSVIVKPAADRRGLDLWKAEPLQRWLEEKPDALVYIFVTHVTAFFFDPVRLAGNRLISMALPVRRRTTLSAAGRATRRSQGTLAPA